MATHPGTSSGTVEVNGAQLYDEGRGRGRLLGQMSLGGLAAGMEDKVSTMNEDVLLHEVKGQGEPLVLVPGGLSGWLSWIPFAERLAKDRTVVRVQLRSVELAEAGQPYPAGYGTLTEREVLRATVDQLGLDRFDLAGWSYGGHVALAFTLEYPERVRTLTVIEPPAVWILRETGHAADALRQSEAYDRSVSGREVTIDDLKAFLVRAGLGRPGDDFESLPSWPIWVRNRQVLSTNGTIWDYTDSLDRLRALDVPVLGVKGTETTEDLAAIVDDLVANVPHGTLLELPGGHACHIQNVDRFLEELTRHTAAVPS
ncbi:MAG: alpha/beta hydrolase [Chloroflexi bacterium]|nr:alpha/beta hydrolase [Chloroflexota bacterium]